MDQEAVDLWKDLIATRRAERSDGFAEQLCRHRESLTTRGRISGLFVREAEDRCAAELTARAELWWECCRKVLDAGQFPVDQRTMPQLHLVFDQEILADHQALLHALDRSLTRGMPKDGIGDTLETAKERAKRTFRDQLGLVALTQRRSLLQLGELLMAPRYAAVLKHWKTAAELSSVDPTGALREGVTALEVAGRLVVRNQSATLGAILEELRKEQRFASPLLDAIEKVWSFATAGAGAGEAPAMPAETIQAELQFCLDTVGATLHVMLILDHPV